MKLTTDISEVRYGGPISRFIIIIISLFFLMNGALTDTTYQAGNEANELAEFLDQDKDKDKDKEGFEDDQNELDDYLLSSGWGILWVEGITSPINKTFSSLYINYFDLKYPPPESVSSALLEA